MIDRVARDVAADLLEKFRIGVVTNDELEDQWPISKLDPALDEIAQEIWATYDDMKEYRIDPQRIDPEQNDLYRRVILFLKTSCEYQWPLRPRSGVISLFVGFVTLGIVHLMRFWVRRNAFRAAGEISAWPFLRCSELRAAEDAKSSEERRTIGALRG